MQELLGKGAFGNVYQVKKDNGETLYAMKQLPLDAVGQGDASQSASYLHREVSILTMLNHPNVIHYYESFKVGESLYIVMELVEGATLLDHLSSLTEKGQQMGEEAIWGLCWAPWWLLGGSVGLLGGSVGGPRGVGAPPIRP